MTRQSGLRNTLVLLAWHDMHAVEPLPGYQGRGYIFSVLHVAARELFQKIFLRPKVTRLPEALHLYAPACISSRSTPCLRSAVYCRHTFIHLFPLTSAGGHTTLVLALRLLKMQIQPSNTGCGSASEHPGKERPARRASEADLPARQCYS